MNMSTLKQKIFGDKSKTTIDNDDNVRFTCPQCGKTYTPVLKRKLHGIPIQQEFPHASAWAREQHISHLCSDECWNRFVKN